MVSSVGEFYGLLVEICKVCYPSLDQNMEMEMKYPVRNRNQCSSIAVEIPIMCYVVANHCFLRSQYLAIKFYYYYV